MALTSEEQKLLEFALGMLPAWVRRNDEFLYGAAKMFGSVRTLIEYLFGQTLIGTAVGPGVDTPDWLNQHARDRGTTRADGEDDVTLRARLKQYPDAITRAALLAAVDAVLEANGITTDSAMLELPRDAAYIGEFVAMSGTGGAFVQTGTTSRFTPTVLPWPTPPFRDAAVFPTIQHRLTISGADDAGNDGAFTITGLDGDATIVTNATGVTDAVDAGVSWTVERLDVDGNLRDGFPRVFLGRGYRMTGTRPQTVLLILPFGSTAGIEASVREMLRTKKAAGFRVIVERRLIA